MAETYKRKTFLKISDKHGVVVSAQEKGWMNSDQMKIWIKKAWCSRTGGLGRRRSLLVYGPFEARLADTVKASLRRGNTDLAVIPGGLTSLLQPWDVSLNKPLKVRVKKQWRDWMAEFTPTGHKRNLN